MPPVLGAAILHADVGLSDLRVLVALTELLDEREARPVMTQEIADSLDMHRQQASRAVTHLEALGFLVADVEQPRTGNFRRYRLANPALAHPVEPGPSASMALTQPLAA